MSLSNLNRASEILDNIKALRKAEKKALQGAKEAHIAMQLTDETYPDTVQLIKDRTQQHISPLEAEYIAL
jgi:hypothetical protein